MGQVGAFRRTPSAVYLVEEQANPSTDYFVFPAVSRRGEPVVHCSGNELPSPAELSGATVIFVRYVPTRWLRLIEVVRAQLSGLVFFMDDDVLDLHASVGMPWRYRYKLARWAAFRKRWLRQQNASLWVSTLYLQNKYASWNPRLVLPSPLPGITDVRRVFYHGTASHLEEIRWLRPVMEEVLQSDDRVWFEVTGGDEVYRLYRGLPRVTVVHPMKWPSYQRFLISAERHIGLVPLLESPFNNARSYTKLFDVTRCGAVGIYSRGEVFDGVIKDGVQGRVVDAHQDAWINAVLELSRDEGRRLAMLAKARERITELAGIARETNSSTESTIIPVGLSGG